jgi:uncharacterized protein (TIGR02271 family)
MSSLRLTRRLSSHYFGEGLDVQKRILETGKVRVRKEVRMEVQNIQVPTVQQNVDIERDRSITRRSPKSFR